MVITWRDLLAAALATVLASSCSTSPSGAGFTNGDTTPLSAEEKPALRDDLRMPTEADSGDAKLADSAASSPASTGNDAGTGGRNSAKADPAGPTGSTTPPSTPPRIEAPAESGAQGETRPEGNINTGTPRSPQ